MGVQDDQSRPSARQIFEETLSGARPRPFIPHLRSDPASYQPIPHSLREFREQEGAEHRRKRLRALWAKLPKRDNAPAIDDETVARAYPVKRDEDLTADSARQLGEMYEDELLGRCGVHSQGPFSRRVSWPEFEKYADAKETELWHIFHDELDLDGNGHLDAEELQLALQKAGIALAPSTLSEFITFLTSSPHSHAINFEEFRDFLLLMPRKASPEEIFRYYEVRKFMGDDGRGAARVTMEGDVSLSAEDLALGGPVHSAASPRDVQPLLVDHKASVDDGEDDDVEYDDLEDEEPHHIWLGGKTAVKFLLAGGFAGAVSRTCTAPFDRLKIFLITRPPELGGTTLSSQTPIRGIKAIMGAIARIYSEGGVLAFWTGNGLSVAKILPESAIKFLTYESSKRMFAQYWDKVDDPRDISGVSRFLSGGLGGISSQLSIYPIETLKTQMMSSAGGERRSLREAAVRLWQLGGFRAYYRGLTIGLVGVFPYSAIDMSTFEALKLAYLRSTGKDEPGVLALLAFGSVSGSVGATSVYPLNLVRTRLQASGSSGHPERYTGIMDVVQKTYAKDGWRGFYRGLLPTLAKVVPAVSISYVVYESSKSKLGV
ncbi:mitochondrial carrier [Dichomitus squalens]|uniref:Mitochondrial carrier n=2 Tax=Dichomitus squalens TaxID=114155 RepID=A0A4Q9NXR2_9APHY|nr:mitochondrial carrier [Dichomitus squalens LYAD-421 SS1]EJF61198.1 mitochondrial carrier [Dichomitus squalens LYAD-421 SS1]TBU45052.1 mitochondrial carrier [Dichomitus squalens]TBU63938.1 mitochondrial carrier [Dichomitus squalens]